MCICGFNSPAPARKKMVYNISPENIERLKILNPSSYEKLKGGIEIMDISNWTKKANTFIKAEDIKANPQGIFVITDEGQMVKSEKFGTEQFHLSGEFAGEEKTLTLSKTNARTVEKALGTDTKKWVGHSLSFDLYRVKTSDGKMVDAINVASVK